VLSVLGCQSPFLTLFQVREARVSSLSYVWPVLEFTWCLYRLYVAVNI